MDPQSPADFVHHPGDSEMGRASTRTLGQKLRDAREAIGLSLPELSARTRVPERMLVSIEAGAYEALPPTTFTAGFIRSFAREVGMSEAEAAVQYRAENTRVATAPAPVSMRPVEPQRVPSRQLAWASAAIAAILVLGGGIYFATRNREPVGQVASTAPAPATTLSPSSPPSTPPPVSNSAASSAIAPPPMATTPTVTAPVASAAAAGAVTLTATQDAWIQVRDRSTHTRVKSGVLAQGQSFTVPPGDYTLSTGRAGALQVKIGDRLLPPLGGAVDILRDISLDPASLAARGGPSVPAATAPPSPFASSSRSPTG